MRKWPLRAFLVRDTDSTVPLAYQLGDEGLIGYQHLGRPLRRLSPS
jgi:hypothetical protein